MTIRDLLEQGIDIQGKIIIKRYNEEKEDYTVLYTCESGIYNNDIFENVIDNEITFMYSENGYMIFEVK